MIKQFNIAIALFFMTVLTSGLCQAAPANCANGEEGWEETPWSDTQAASRHYDNDLPGVSIETVYEPEKPAPVPEFEPQPEEEQDYTLEPAAEPGNQGQQPHLYTLKIGDKLLITVYGEPATRRIVTVDPSGSIAYLIVNSLHVEGKTIAELRELLQEKLKSYYKYPLLIINPVALSGDFLTVIGEVLRPGNQLYKGHPTLTTAICTAGGFTSRLFRNHTVDQADLDRSFLARKGEYVPVDFKRLVRDGDSSQDIPLLPGDYIYIASRTLSRVYVLGEVGGATSVAFFDTLTLSQALAEAGGLSPFASSRIAVIRGSLCCPIRFLIDFNLIKKGCALDFPLQPGDIVYVPTMQYATIKEIVEAGIASFVAQAASFAGTATFVSVTPKAAGTVLFTPTTVINTGGIGTVTSTPVIAAPAAAPVQ